MNFQYGHIHIGGGEGVKRLPGWSTVLGESWALVRTHRGRLSLGLLLLACNRAAELVLPASTGWLIDEVVAKSRTDLLWTIVAAVLVATVVQAASGFALSQVLGVAAQRTINDARLALHWHVLRLPLARFDATQSGQLVSRVMNDAEGIRNLVGTGIVQLAGGLLTAATVFGILLWLDWHMTVVIAVLLSIFAVTTMVALTRLRPLFREQRQANAEIAGRLTQVLGGMRVVKGYTAEAREQRVFANHIGRLFDLTRRTITGFSLLNTSGVLLIGLFAAAMLGLGGRALASGEMSVGQFLQYVLFTGLLAAPVMQIATIGTQLTEAFAGLDRIRELRSQATEDADAATRAACPVLHGAVELESVSFGYDPARPVLHDISLTVMPGQTVALVGPSGSGKTTLVSLVMGFHRPQRGRILVDGRDLSGLALDGYRRQLGVVLQDNVIFDGTVRDNLLFARPEADETRLRAAAEAAQAMEFISQLEKGWDTLVGERGVRLSGGQRQRLGIARALLADPRILILDEATSSLDSDSEAGIQAALTKLRSGRTTFVIAHRLSTIRAADLICVLDGGRIVERGRHDALIAQNGLYRRLHDRQMGLAAEWYRNPGEAW